MEVSMLTDMIIRAAMILVFLIGAPALFIYSHRLELLDLILICLTLLAAMGTWMLSQQK
jgi:hypothetical protein